MDGVDEAAQLELYSVADRQPMQLDQGQRDMVGATNSRICLHELESFNRQLELPTLTP